MMLLALFAPLVAAQGCETWCNEGTVQLARLHMSQSRHKSLLSCVTGPRSFPARSLCAVLLAAVPVLPALRRPNNGNMCLSWCNMDLQPAGVPRLRDLHWWWRRRHRIATAAAATHLCAVVQPLDVPEPSVLVLRDLRRRRRLAAAHAGRLAAHGLVAPSAAHVRKPGLLAMCRRPGPRRVVVPRRRPRQLLHPRLVRVHLRDAAVLTGS